MWPPRCAGGSDLVRNSDAQTRGLSDVHVLGIVLALEVGPLRRLILDDELEDALRSAALGLAALAALGAEGIGKDTWEGVTGRY